MANGYLQIPIPSFRLDLTGKIIEANENFRKVMSIPESTDITELSITQFIRGKSSGQNWIARLLTESPARITELHCSNWNDVDIWVESFTHVEKNESGKAFAISGVWIDLTSKKLASQETRRLLEVIKQAPIGLVLTDIDGQIYYVNQHFCKVSGYSSHEVIGKSPSFLKSGMHDDEFYEDLWGHLKAGKIWNGIFINKRKDGSIFYEDATVFPLVDNNNKPVGYTAIKLDISEQYKIQQELLRAGHTLNSVFTNIQEGIVRLSLNGTIDMINPAFCREFNLDLNHDYIGEKIAELVPQRLINFEKLIDQLAIDEEIYHLVVEDHPVYYRINGKLLKQEEQNPLFIISIDNISEEKILERQLIETQKTEALGDIAEGITHDFNNVLSNISASLYKLENENHIPEDIAKIIDSSVKRGKNVTERLLTFVKPMKPVIKSFDVINFIQELSYLVDHSLAKNIHFRYVLPESSRFISGDKKQLNLLFLNLILNSADAMPNGGIADLEFVENIPDHLYFGPKDKEQSDFHLFIIKDTGTGIAKSDLEKVFNPFFSTKPKGKGTGLGLNVVKKILDIHNGWIHLDSHFGFGTEVYVGLEKASEPTIEMRLPTRDPATLKDMTHKPRLMLIEDEEDLRILLESILQQADFLVDSFDDGRSALKAYEKDPQQFDLVITDLGLPDFKGTTVVKKIYEIRPEQKLLVMTGYLSNEMFDSLKELGINDFMRKPFSISDFIQAITDVLVGAVK